MPLSAVDLLRDPQGIAAAWTATGGCPAVVVLVGTDPFLNRETLAALRNHLCPDEADRSWAWREFSGDDEPDPRDVLDEAATVPMFDSAIRAAVVRGADGFVTAARDRLETVADRPSRGRGVVVLEVRSFPATTRLAKAVARHGLVIETSLPKRFDPTAWVRDWARRRHGVGLVPLAAERLIERLGVDLGQIDQMLMRLAAALEPTASPAVIGPEMIDTVGATPQEKSAWGMLDAATTGRTAAALGELDQLLSTGENPIGLSAQAAAVLRRLSAAARLLAQQSPRDLTETLREAGVAAWPQAMATARDSLTHLGARRARRLPLMIEGLDRALKGDASRGLPARLALERLFCWMAGADRPRPSKENRRR
jgi:DNA polymerase-3 subunit delta